MELSELKTKIIQSFTGSPEDLAEVLQIIENDNAIFPFNEYEHLICNLIEKEGLTYQQYIEIRTEYVNANPNLWIFEMSAPRTFGESYAQNFVTAKCSKLKRPSKILDPTYNGEYDLWLDGIKIEVKASRATDSDLEAPLYMKALSRNTNKRFLMNFQQLKPQYCDVFIWVAVFRDEIVVWVMSSKEVVENPLYSKGQHRGNSGNEGQLHIKNDNIHVLNPYQLRDDNLEIAIRTAAQRNN
jgi:hypothetical protein